MLTLDTNSGQVADDLSGAVSAALPDADEEAATLALRLVNPRTPRKAGTLAAGLASAAVPEGGFAVTDPVDYANVVNERTGFISGTVVEAAEQFADVYDRHIQDTFDRL